MRFYVDTTRHTDDAISIGRDDAFIMYGPKRWPCSKCTVWTRKEMERIVYTFIVTVYVGIRVKCPADIVDMAQQGREMPSADGEFWSSNGVKINRMNIEPLNVRVKMPKVLAQIPDKAIPIITVHDIVAAMTKHFTLSHFSKELLEIVTTVVDSVTIHFDLYHKCHKNEKLLVKYVAPTLYEWQLFESFQFSAINMGRP